MNKILSRYIKILPIVCCFLTTSFSYPIQASETLKAAPVSGQAYHAKATTARYSKKIISLKQQGFKETAPGTWTRVVGGVTQTRHTIVIVP